MKDFTATRADGDGNAQAGEGNAPISIAPLPSVFNSEFNSSSQLSKPRFNSFVKMRAVFGGNSKCNCCLWCFNCFCKCFFMFSSLCRWLLFLLVAEMWDDISNMAAERAAPERDVDTRTPLLPPVEFECGALDGRRLPYEPNELLERMLERDDGRPEWTDNN